MNKFKRITFLFQGLIVILLLNAKTYAVSNFNFIQEGWIGNEAILNLPLPDRKGVLTGTFSATDVNRDNILSYQAEGPDKEISSLFLTFVTDSDSVEDRSVPSLSASLIDLVRFDWTLGQAFGQTLSDEISVSLVPFYEVYSYGASASSGFIIDNYQTNNQSTTDSPLIISQVPEIDGAGAPIALALLAGIGLIFRERRSMYKQL